MPKRGSSPDAARRNFLKGAGLIGAAAAVAPPAANALPVAPPTQLKAAVPGPRQIAAETMPPGSDPINQTTSGGDFMTDVVNSLGIEYLAINCVALPFFDHGEMQRSKFFAARLKADLRPASIWRLTASVSAGSEASPSPAMSRSISWKRPKS